MPCDFHRIRLNNGGFVPIQRDMVNDSDATFYQALLEFLRRAGSERTTARLVGEMFRFTGEIFSAHRVSMFLAPPDGGRLRPFVSELVSGDVDPVLFEQWRHLDVEQFSCVQAIRAGETVVVAKDPNEGMPSDVVEHFGVEPFVAAALREGGSLIGVLVVEGSPEVLGERGDQIAEFGQYLALTLENARAFEREQQRVRDAEALLEVGEVLTRTTELLPVLGSVAQNCARVSSFDRCSVFLLDDTGKLVPMMSQYADGRIDEEAWSRFTDAEHDLPPAWEVLRTGRALAFDDTERLPDQEPKWWKGRFAVRSVLFLPLTAWGRRFGVLALDRSEPQRISEQQIRVSQGLATQGAAAIGLSRSLTRERTAVAGLRELDDLKNNFLASVSHELRTPLTAITGFSSILDEYVEDGEARDYLKQIQNESDHLESLIANLLLATRLDAGVLELRREVLDLGPMIRESADLVEHVYPGRDYEVKVPDGLVMEEGDAECLRQVFTNLIENAAKFSPDGATIDVFASLDDDDAIRVVVIDGGPGLTDDELANVFIRFRKGTSELVQGTGVGLYMVKELVEGHGGRVWAENGPEGVGTRFVTLFPSRAVRLEAPTDAAE